MKESHVEALMFPSSNGCSLPVFTFELILRIWPKLEKVSEKDYKKNIPVVIPQSKGEHSLSSQRNIDAK